MHLLGGSLDGLLDGVDHALEVLVGGLLLLVILQLLNEESLDGVFCS